MAASLPWDCLEQAPMSAWREVRSVTFGINQLPKAKANHFYLFPFETYCMNAVDVQHGKQDVFGPRAKYEAQAEELSTLDEFRNIYYIIGKFPDFLKLMVSSGIIFFATA